MIVVVETLLHHQVVQAAVVVMVKAEQQVFLVKDIMVLVLAAEVGQVLTQVVALEALVKQIQ